MTRKIFSKGYRTFAKWLRAQPRGSTYARKIARLHERFPSLALRELRNLRMGSVNLSTTPWNALTSIQKSERNLAFEVLRRMRKGDRLSPLLEHLGIPRDSVMKHLGNIISKSRGYWRARASDTIQAGMFFYDRELGPITIVTTNSRDRSLIGRYFASVKVALKTGDPSVLKPFQDITITDAEGVTHRFETDLDRLYEIEEAQEEPEFFEVYQD